MIAMLQTSRICKEHYTATPEVGCKIYGKNKIFVDPFLNSELFVSLKLWGYFFATKAQKHQVSQKII